MAQNILSPVKVATNTHVTFGAQSRTIDGILLAEGDRVLVKSQTNPVENGIYVLAANGSLSRATDFAAAATQSTLQSAIVFVEQGTIFGETGWIISNDGNFTVDTSAINFKRFTINENIQSLVDDILSYIVLRREKGIPLTNDELDNNFLYLSNAIEGRVRKVDYTKEDVVAKIKADPSSVTLIDSYSVRNLTTDTTPGLAIRDANNNISATSFTGALVGNANTATLATTATLAGNVTGVVAIANGGTGRTSASEARTSLEVLHNKGDTMVGKLNLTPPAGTSIALLNIAPTIPVNPINGDVWLNESGVIKTIQYRLGDTYTVAITDSPVFIGTPTAPTPSDSDNGQRLATTAFVKSVNYIKGEVDNFLSAKAPLVSPEFTGVPLAPTPSEGDNSTKIATTAFIQTIKTNIDNQLDSKSPLASPTFTGTPRAPTPPIDGGTQIATADLVKNVRDTINTTKANTSDVNAALALKANITYVDSQISGLGTIYKTIASAAEDQPKWGASRKFVQADTPSSAVNGDFWFKT